MLISESCVKCLPARFVMLALLCLGTMCQYDIMEGFAVVVRSMQGSSTSGNSTSSEQEDVFAWSADKRRLLLNAFYYGYVATQLLGGRLAELLGARIVVVSGIGASGVLYLLSPLVARWHVDVLLAARVLQGVLCGAFFPSLQLIFSRWFPRNKHQTYIGVLNSFMFVGSITASGLNGRLAAVSWDLAFYVSGAKSLFWAVLCFKLLHESPEEHASISPEEHDYIVTGSDRQSSKARYSAPWCAILSCVSLWATILSQAGGTFISYTLLSELPTYLANVLGFNVSHDTLLLILPYVSAFLGCVGSGYIAQVLQRKGMPRLTCYKIFNGLSAIGPAACLLAIMYINDSHTTVFAVLLVVATFCYGTFFGGGSVANALDLGINFTGTLYGLNLKVCNFVHIITPLVAEALTDPHHTRGQWQVMFYIAIVMSVAPYVMFLFFGSTDEQHWNNVEREEILSEEAT